MSIYVFTLFPELVNARYDKDGNNEPCCKKGHKAHWAVLTGEFYSVLVSPMW